MTFAFPAYHTENVVFGQSDITVRQAIIETFERLKWRYTGETDNKISAKAKVNFASWGERIEIVFVSGSEFEITSKCVFPTQCFDWGKNRKNVAAFKTAFFEVFEEPPPRINWGQPHE